ncbi:MAG TPA: hypothetical protein VFS22_07860, partial [Flavisolibacter sp.]|nr:hypothetical protein [Flavisolibacter sp.]
SLSPPFAFSFLQTLLRSNALAFSYSSQLSTPVRDLHPIVKEHAWRTNKKPSAFRRWLKLW